MSNESPKTPEQEKVKKIIEQMDALTKDEQLAIYHHLNSIRSESALSSEKQIKSENPEVISFFTEQQNNILFKDSCRNANVLPTRDEFIRLMNQDGKLFEHFEEIRSYYPVIDEILKEIKE